MSEKPETLTVIEDPDHEIANIFFASVKSMAILGGFMGIIIGGIITFLFNFPIIGLLSGIFLSLILPLQAIISTRIQSRYFYALVDHLRRVFAANHFYLSNESIRHFLTSKILQVDDKTTIHGHYENDAFHVTLETATNQRPPKEKKKEKFVVKTIDQD